MTVSATSYTPLVYAGNSATTAFSVTFPFFTGTLVVTAISAALVETVQTLTTHYTVAGGTGTDGSPASGTVTMLTAPLTGTWIRIERDTVETQSSTWAESDPFPQDVVEAAFDKARLLDQEALFETRRALKQTKQNFVTDGELTLPDSTALKYLGWNAAGTGLENKNAADFAMSVGTTTTGAAGSSVIVTLGGTATAATLNLTIPRGDVGASGAGTGDMLVANNLSDLASKKTGLDTITIHGADVASAATIDLDAATGNLVDVTGTTTITAITLANGRERTVRFTGALTLTNGASLLLPGAANITTEAGDVAIFRGYAAGVVRCVNYQRITHATLFTDIKQASSTTATGVVELATTAEAATGTDTTRAVVPSGLFPAEADAASATTTDLGAVTSTRVRITGTTTITGFGTVAAGMRRGGRFAGALILTHNATSLILPSAANITTAAGDTFEALSLGSGNWIVTDFTRASGAALVTTGISAATQAELEAASSTTVATTPGRQQFHPSSAKAWVKFTITATVSASYNITSITDTGIGNWTVNIATDFSTANYCGVAFGGMDAATNAGTGLNSYLLQTAAAAGTFHVASQGWNGTSTTQTDPQVNEIYAAFFGDHV